MIRAYFTCALAALAAASAAFAASARQDHASCPTHAEHAPAAGAARDHAGHAADVERRGDAVMGFGHERTVHHFRLTREGGAIEVVATDANDLDGRDRIRRHLRAVARAFADGDFSMPRAIHDAVPPGAEAMAEGRRAIRYTYADLDAGGRVVISTADPALVDAVHAFLRFQIDDHHTGDPVGVE